MYPYKQSVGGKGDEIYVPLLRFALNSIGFYFRNSSKRDGCDPSPPHFIFRIKTRGGIKTGPGLLYGDKISGYLEEFAYLFYIQINYAFLNKNEDG